jgi:hypothetical protein
LRGIDGGTQAGRSRREGERRVRGRGEEGERKVRGKVKGEEVRSLSFLLLRDKKVPSSSSAQSHSRKELPDRGLVKP